MSLPTQTAGLLRLLVVDDDEIDRAQVRRALSKAAPHVALMVEEATSPSEARSAAAAGAFDCILLDYLLPGATASDVLPSLSALQPDAAVVVLTGQGDETIAVELMKAGVADYLPKEGLDPTRLWAAIRYAVAMSRVRRDTARFEAARRRRALQLRTLVEAAPLISGALTIEDLARTAAERACDVLDVAAAYVRLIDGEGDAQSLVVAQSHTQEVGHESLWQRACEAAKPGRQPCRVSLQGPYGIGALVVTLYARDGSVVGAMAASEPRDPSEAESCEQMLAQLAQIVSVALDNACLLRETQRAVRARDEVMAVVSHDLRTPLGNVKLGLELLREHIAGDDLSLLDRIERSVHHMARLVDDLVDMARIEGRKLDLTLRSESVQDVLSTAASLSQGQAEAAHVELLTFPTKDSLRARIDRHRVLQVLSNLLGNAIKFTPPGGRVELRAERQGAEVCLEVRDSGSGIAPEDAPHVFTRFFRAPNARRGGLGLGLYIAKAVVDAHGGRIWFESVPGRGTSFCFTVPLAADDDDTGMLLDSPGS